MVRLNHFRDYIKLKKHFQNKGDGGGGKVFPTERQ